MRSDSPHQHEICSSARGIADFGQRMCSTPVVASHPCPTLFHEQWWLDLATEGRWRALRHYEGHRIVGWMPVFETRSLGHTIVKMPPLTHCLGPALAESVLSRHGNAFRKRHSIIMGLLDQLAPMGSFNQKIHRHIDDALAFQRKDFSVAVQQTFVVGGRDTDTVWKELRAETRNQIRTAAKSFVVRTGIDASAFLDLYDDNQASHGRNAIAARPVVFRLIATALAKGCAKTYFVADDVGKTVAAILCLTDETSVYYSLSTRNKQASSGIIPLLIWHAVRNALSDGKIFDFEGIGYAGAINLYSSFSPNIVNRLVVSKCSRLFQIYKDLKSCVGPDRSRFE